MRKRKFAAVILSLLLIILSGCGGGYRTSEKDFYSKLDLQDGEFAAVFDVSGSRMLFSTYKEYEEGDPRFSEVGYSSYTTEVGIYDFDKETVVCSIPFSEGTLHVGGALSEKGAALVTLDIEDSNCQYHIQTYDGSTLTDCITGTCANHAYSEPSVVTLENNLFVCVYSNHADGETGICFLQESGEILSKRILSASENIEHISTSLVSNGKYYSYHAVINGKSTVVIESEQGVECQIETSDLDFYDYCLIGQKVLFAAPSRLVVKDWNSSTLLEITTPDMYRLASDGESKVLAIDGKYQPYLISIDEDIELQKLEDVQATPVLFYGIDKGQFLMHFDDPSRPNGVQVVLFSEV